MENQEFNNNIVTISLPHVPNYQFKTSEWEITVSFGQSYVNHETAIVYNIHGYIPASCATTSYPHFTGHFTAGRLGAYNTRLNQLFL